MKHPSSKATESKPEPIPERKFLLTKILPTDRLSLKDQLSILRAFASASTEKNFMPVTNSEVARMANLEVRVSDHVWSPKEIVSLLATN